LKGEEKNSFQIFEANGVKWKLQTIKFSFLTIKYFHNNNRGPLIFAHTRCVFFFFFQHSKRWITTPWTPTICFHSCLMPFAKIYGGSLQFYGPISRNICDYVSIILILMFFHCRQWEKAFPFIMRLASTVYVIHFEHFCFASPS
jgi:hypothetical protein